MNPIYRQLRDDDDFDVSEKDNGEETSFLSPDNGLRRVTQRSLLTFTVCNVVLFAASLALFIQPLAFHSTSQLNPELRRTSTYSPVHDLVDLELHQIQVNGSFFMNDSPSIARAMPNPASDALWEEIELARVIPVTRAQIMKMGKDPSTVTKLEDDVWGLGDDSYAATFDLYHQLHCLNALRRIAYGSTYYRSDGKQGNASRSGDDLGSQELHINHCVDILYQALICSGHVNLLTSHWVETQDHPFPDMSVKRQCINFDKLTEWRKENSIDMEKYGEVMAMKPVGVNEAPIDEGYWKLHPDLLAKHPTHPPGQPIG